MKLAGGLLEDNTRSGGCNSRHGLTSRLGLSQFAHRQTQLSHPATIIDRKVHKKKHPPLPVTRGYRCLLWCGISCQKPNRFCNGSGNEFYKQYLSYNI